MLRIYSFFFFFRADAIFVHLALDVKDPAIWLSNNHVLKSFQQNIQIFRKRFTSKPGVEDALRLCNWRNYHKQGGSEILVWKFSFFQAKVRHQTNDTATMHMVLLCHSITDAKNLSSSNTSINPENTLRMFAVTHNPSFSPFLFCSFFHYSDRHTRVHTRSGIYVYFYHNRSKNTAKSSFWSSPKDYRGLSLIFFQVKFISKTDWSTWTVCA